MRKILTVVVLLLCASTAHAQGTRTHQFTAAANDVSISLAGSGIAYHTLGWNPVGTVSACAGKLQQSANGTVWTDLIASMDCSVPGTSAVTAGSVNYVRMIVTSFTGTGSTYGIWRGYTSNPAGVSPGGATGTVQYNNAGAFGGIAGLTNGLAANCDGFTDPCKLLVTIPSGSGGIPYTMATQVTGGPAGNYTTQLTSDNTMTGDVYQFFDAYNGSAYSFLAISPLTGITAAPFFSSRAYEYSQFSGSDACPTATICEHTPSGAVTAYNVVKPAVASQGTIFQRLETGDVGPVVTQSLSGDTQHSKTVTIGSGTALPSTELCGTSFCIAGTYRVNAYLDITTACGATGTYVVNLIYTDDQGTKTVPMNLQGTGAVPATGVVTLSSTANFGQAAQILRSTGVNGINYSATIGACGAGGPMVGKLYLSVEPVQ